MKILNPFQVDFSGVHLIEASAGTGKTYNISSLYVRAIAEGRFSVDQILVVTYTEAATKELRDRLMKRLRESIGILKGESAGNDSFLCALKENIVDESQAINRLKNAIHSFDEAAVYTIHGFCRHVLQEYAFKSGAPFEAELIGDDTEIIQEIVDDYWRKWVWETSASRLKKPLLQLIMDKGYTPETLANGLAASVGKPYMTVRPQEIQLQERDKKLYEASTIFENLKEGWEDNRQTIFQLLDAGNLKYYRTDWLQSWMQEMDYWLQTEVLPIEVFDKISRFSQSYINAQVKKGKTPPQHVFFEQVDQYINLVEDLKDFDIIFKSDLLEYMRENVSDLKEERQVFSFDDLLIQLRNALHHPERGGRLQKSMQRAYPMALVDEFQDTDPIQYEIFKTIYAGRDDVSLFMIGDPKQSIYSFRGADIFAYLEAKEDADKNKIFSLDKNYRSVPKLIAGVNALFQSHDNPFILENIPFEPVRAGYKTNQHLTIAGKQAIPLEMRRLTFASDDGEVNKREAKDRSARDTAVQIHAMLAKASHGEALLGETPVQAKDIAVLVRSHHQAELISEALHERGIKSVKHSRESVFHSDEARELTYVLRAIVEPANEQYITTALSCKMFGYNARRLQEMKENESVWAAKRLLFSDWHSVWQQHGFAYMFRNMMQEEDVAETVITYRDGERKLTNLIHLSELIAKKEKQEHAGLYTILKWLAQKRNEENKEVEDEQLRLESDENLVSVVTMHHSKGLEYPVVFCPFLWDAPQNKDNGGPIVYHDPDDKASVYFDLHGKGDPRRSQKRFWRAKEELAESVRLAYVAITRAKYKCVIPWIHAKNCAHSSLGFLLLGSDEALASLRASVDSDKKYNKQTRPLFQAAFDQLAENRAISCPVITGYSHQFGLFDQEYTPSFEAEKFNRALPLPAGPGMASFSALIRNEQDDFEKNYLAYLDEDFDEETDQRPRPGTSIFDFPKGPKPGTAVHHIFENIAFDDPEGWNTVIHEQLLGQAIDTRWTPVVSRMVKATVNHALIKNKPGFTLSNVERNRMIPELEFYFTIGAIRLPEILSIIRPNVPSSFSLEGFAEEGFLKGFIDLTFEYHGRYYILDYKTNYLGDTLKDYRTDVLSEEMKEAMYDLQYHLYSVALHRFLRQRLKNYNYENHFGGAIYLFVRGINEKGNEGIFFDRPDFNIIKNLNTYLNNHSDS